jgi:V/A-type H+-transporting ATPase subunit I
MEKIDGVSCVEDEPGSNPSIPAPPTRLRNLRLIEPFEFFVMMYGLPRYGEFDPTPLIAVLYTLFFGLMFGDIGQGLVLSAVGLLLWRFKRFALGKILGIVGVASACFGVLYGSVFGFELEGFGFRALAPGNLNTTLLISIGLGVLIISMSIVINIVNGARQKNFEKMLFSNNGLMGLVFYWAVIVAAVSLMLFGVDLINPFYIAGFIILPLLFIFLREPLGRLVAREKNWAPGKKGEYVLENSFELFEIVLSFVTTTFSFLRLGAYAMSHAGMMTVVYMLAENAAGSHNFLVVAFGNVFVIGMEGLIVGVQCLRLDFYEVFSRFFEGTGKPFTPVKIDYSAK